jgi:hypothetical protein
VQVRLHHFKIISSIARLVNMIASRSKQRYGCAFALLLIAGLSQSTAFRSRHSDNSASQEEASESFVPFVRPNRVAAGDLKKTAAAEPQVGTFGFGSKSLTQGQAFSYRQALKSVRANGDDSADGEDAMRDLALAAMDSGGDPSQIAAFVLNLKGKDKAKMATMKNDVTELAKTLPGVTAPLGFFDPAGFCTDCSEGKLCFYREVELKHGRVGMLASLGFFMGETFHPLFGGSVDAPSYLAFQQTPLQTFWPAVVAAIAIPETFSAFSFNEPVKGSERWTMRTDRVPGDFGFDPWGIKPTDPDELKEMQTKEINNGRLAMLAAAGMIAQELATGDKLFAGVAFPIPILTRYPL